MGELGSNKEKIGENKLSNEMKDNKETTDREIDIVFSTTNTTITQDIAIDSPYSSENSSIDNSYSGNPTSIEADYEEIDGHKEVLSESLEACLEAEDKSLEALPKNRGIRLTDVEVQRRVDNCFNLRYNSEKPILQREWIEVCKKQYGDKSIPMYTHYWMKAKNDYDEIWRGSLEGMLKGATDSLRESLNSDIPSIKQRAIDQIMKYTGNDIQKHLIKGQVEHYNIKFGEDI